MFRRIALIVTILAPSSSVYSFLLPYTSYKHVDNYRTTNGVAAPLEDGLSSSEPTTIEATANVKRTGALSMGLEELAIALGGMGRAQLAWDCMSIGVDPQLYHSNEEHSLEPEIQQLLPSCRRTQRLGKEALERLSNLYDNVGRIEGGVASLSHISGSSDLTTKLLLKLADGMEVETVIIPSNGTRSTLCISSQVGCRQGCTFCATGRMGRLRSLSSDEILAQMFFARKICRIHDLPAVSNVVFMGMGEPADNVDAVVRATEILTRRELFQLSATKVTISTVAPTPDAFQRLGEAPCLLAWSVHAANDELRKQLVPTTKHSMSELRQGMVDALLKRPEKRHRAAMWEVALIEGINDSMEAADELAAFARGFIDQVPGVKLVVNLIPFNDIGHPLYKTPTRDAVVAFQRRLWTQGIYAPIRTTRGDDESAACGQLATKRRQPSVSTSF